MKFPHEELITLDLNEHDQDSGSMAFFKQFDYNQTTVGPTYAKFYVKMSINIKGQVINGMEPLAGSYLPGMFINSSGTR